MHELFLGNSLRKQLRNQSDDVRQLLLWSRRRSVTPRAKSSCGLRGARVARPGCSDHADLVSKTNGRTRAHKTFHASSHRTDGAGICGAVLRFCVCKVGQTITGIPSLSFLLSRRTSSLSLEERRYRCGIGEVRGSPFHLFLCLYFLSLFGGRSSFSKTEGKAQGVHLPPRPPCSPTFSTRMVQPSKSMNWNPGLPLHHAWCCKFYKSGNVPQKYICPFPPQLLASHWSFLPSPWFFPECHIVGVRDGLFSEPSAFSDGFFHFVICT